MAGIDEWHVMLRKITHEELEKVVRTDYLLLDDYALRMEGQDCNDPRACSEVSFVFGKDAVQTDLCGKNR